MPHTISILPYLEMYVFCFSHSQGLAIEEIDLIFEKALQMQMQPNSKLTADLDNRTKKKPFGKVNIFQYQCKVTGCKFRTRRVRLMDHYVKQHNMEETEAEKLVPPRFDTTAKMEKIQCPRCRLEFAPLFLRRHIFQRYMHLL